MVSILWLGGALHRVTDKINFVLRVAFDFVAFANLLHFKRKSLLEVEVILPNVEEIK